MLNVFLDQLREQHEWNDIQSELFHNQERRLHDRSLQDVAQKRFLNLKEKMTSNEEWREKWEKKEASVEEVKSQQKEIIELKETLQQTLRRNEELGMEMARCRLQYSLLTLTFQFYLLGKLNQSDKLIS
ncbi:hypothetical protein THRCLA_22924 [Thraustotheca clavata]|uniref:Uncharacterized protein n=1 Tax=Thraustotheca clavata TaxID=74557 RepID=A0A1V9YNJ6_9STRA|nr:hypothetical protein THRCLA_22924 [Thraustotheca clavata]